MNKPSTETKRKVTQVFRKLEKAGYFAKRDFWCCQSCGWAAVPKAMKKVVFYHHQDKQSWEKGYPLHLAWDGDAKEICTIIESCGLKVEHDGSENSRIKILPE